MWQRSNFRLYSAEHRATLTLQKDYDTDEEVTHFLEDDADVVSLFYYGEVAFDLITGEQIGFGPPSGTLVPHPNNPGDDLYFGYDFRLKVFPEPEVYCIYIGQISVTGCTMRVSLIDGTVIGSTDQVDDFLFFEMPVVGDLDRLIIQVTFPREGNSDPDLQYRVTMTPPFFGGVDIAEQTKACYAYGAVTEFGEEPQYQATLTQAFEEHRPNFRKTSILLEAATLEQRNSLIDFFRSPKRRLTLLVREEGSTKHDFNLGPSTATSSTQNQGNLNSMDITTRDKYDLTE